LSTACRRLHGARNRLEREPPPLPVPWRAGAQLTPSANGAAEATTATSTETVDLALTASRPTWIEVRAGSATGTVLYTGTLASGTTKSFRGNAIWVRFGVASNVDAHLNGQRLRLAAGTYDAVFDTGGYHHVS